MKYTNIRAFEKHLGEAAPAHFSPVYLVVAKEPFALQTAAALLVKALNKSNVAPKSFRGDESAVEGLLFELESPSLFGGARCALMHQVDKLPKASLEKLEGYLQRPAKGAFLILTAASLSAASGFYKKAEKAGIVLDLPEEKPWEKEKALPQWLVAEAAARGKKMEPQAAAALVRQAGLDQALLEQELEKLICYCGEREAIAAADVKAICSGNSSETIWQLGEAVTRRDAPAALRISKALLEEGTAFLGMLRQLRTLFETDYQISTLLAGGAGPADVAAQFPYMKGMILEKHLQAARGYGKERFRQGLLRIDEAELRAKNSVDNDVLNEILMINLTQ